MAIEEYGNIDTAMETAGMTSDKTHHIPRMTLKLKEANRTINLKINEAGITLPTAGDGSDDTNYLDDVANAWAAGLFHEEIGQRAKQGRSRGIFSAVDVLHARAMEALKYWMNARTGGGTEAWEMQRIEGEGINEEK